MSIRFDKVTIRVSELQTTPVVVAPWETPILQAMYGEEAQVVGHVEIERELPGAADEFARLAQRYGPKNSETPIVAAVYGNFGPGVNALGKAIRDAENGFEQEVLVGGEVVGLTDEEIDKVMAADEEKQPVIIEHIEPQPPLKGSNLAIENSKGESLADLV